MICSECGKQMEFDEILLEYKCQNCGNIERDDEWFQCWERDEFGDN